MQPKSKTTTARLASPKKPRSRPASGPAMTRQNLAILVGGLLLFSFYSHCEVDAPVHLEVPVQIHGNVIFER